MEAERLVQQVYEAGVVGAGGAGFPTHVKLKAKGIDTYLINGAECEPLLTVDQHLMCEEAPRLVAAGLAVAAALGGARLVFGLKKKYAPQIAALRACGAEVVEVGNSYPAGDEVILIHEILGRHVPEAGLPLQVGVVVNNPETLYNIAGAMDGLPVTHTFVTVGGAVPRPGVWRVPIGAPASLLLDAAGGSIVKDPVFIEGGPMTGKYRFDTNFSVTKTTKGLLVVPRTSALVHYETMPVEQMLKQAKVACCSCVQCTVTCSRNLVGHGLEPHRIMRAIAFASQALPEIVKQAFLCSECNLCSGLVACPMGLSPRRVNQVLKGSLRAQGIKPDFPKRDITPHPQRAFRLVPSKRLVQRLGLASYDRETPYMGDLPVGNTPLAIPTKQHTGVPAVPCVTPGEAVQEGQILGAPPEGALGATIHASLSGTVLAVSPEAVTIQPER